MAVRSFHTSNLRARIGGHRPSSQARYIVLRQFVLSCAGIDATAAIEPGQDVRTGWRSTKHDRPEETPLWRAYDILCTLYVYLDFHVIVGEAVWHSPPSDTGSGSIMRPTLAHTADIHTAHRKIPNYLLHDSDTQRRQRHNHVLLNELPSPDEVLLPAATTSISPELPLGSIDGDLHLIRGRPAMAATALPRLAPRGSAAFRWR